MSTWSKNAANLYLKLRKYSPSESRSPLTHIKCISVAAPSLCQDSGWYLLRAVCLAHSTPLVFDWLQRLTQLQTCSSLKTGRRKENVQSISWELWPCPYEQGYFTKWKCSAPLTPGMHWWDFFSSLLISCFFSEVLPVYFIYLFFFWIWPIVFFS